jgi:glycosyltransferase involved in cell wall biosynthesis
MLLSFLVKRKKGRLSFGGYPFSWADDGGKYLDPGSSERRIEERQEMKIGYFIRNYVLEDSFGKPAFSGGVKIVSQHVKLLNEIGYETLLITKNLPADLNLAELNLYEFPVVVKRDEDIPDCDIYVGAMYSDVKMLFQRGKGKIVHLCEGYEPIDYLSRIKGEVVTEKYLRKGVLSVFGRYINLLKFKKRVKEIESIYALPTVKAAISRHLAELIESRFHQKCFLIQSGIDSSIFYPNEEGIWGRGGRIRILSVGPINVGFKGIPDTLQAIKILKDKGIQMEFIRVSPHPPSEREEVGKVVNQYYINLKEQEMAEIYRNTDIFISSSLEGEGLGLPALEAMASGVPSILTEISSYKNFDARRDFAYFVPTHRPDKIAEGVITFIEDRGLREKFRERGMSVSKRFTLEKTRQDLTNFIKGLME